MTFLNILRWRQRWCSHRAWWTGASLRYMERRPLDPADPASPHVQHLICSRCQDAVPVLNRDRAEHARMLALQPAPPVATHLARSRPVLVDARMRPFTNGYARLYRDDRPDARRRLPEESIDLVVAKSSYGPVETKRLAPPARRNGKAAARAAEPRSQRA